MNESFCIGIGFIERKYENLEIIKEKFLYYNDKTFLIGKLSLATKLILLEKLGYFFVAFLRMLFLMSLKCVFVAFLSVVVIYSIFSSKCMSHKHFGTTGQSSETEMYS